METTTVNTLASRRRAVACAVALTTGTPLAPKRYERYLLSLYEQGVLTIDEVEELLNLSVYQVLYHSRATSLPTEVQLQLLLEQARSYNAQHEITGLLLYSEGRYVQVLEGAEADVHALYIRIQQDPRHEQIITVSEGPGPQRRFADWRMGFDHVDAPAVNQVLDALQAHPLGKEPVVEDTHLQALLQAFGHDPLGVEAPLAQRH